MRATDGLLTVASLTDDVHPLSSTETTALEQLPVPDQELAAVGIDRFDQPAHRGFYERLAAHPTLSINVLDTGSGGADRGVIPAFARARCDVRLVEVMTVHATFEAIRKHVAVHAPNIECGLLDVGCEPSRTDPGCRWTAPVVRALRQVRGTDPLLVPAMGGSLPDYVFTKMLGVPSLGVPFAQADECNHAPDENIELDRYLQAPLIAASLLAELAAEGSQR